MINVDVTALAKRAFARFQQSSKTPRAAELPEHPTNDELRQRLEAVRERDTAEEERDRLERMVRDVLSEEAFEKPVDEVFIHVIAEASRLRYEDSLVALEASRVRCENSSAASSRHFAWSTRVREALDRGLPIPPREIDVFAEMQPSDDHDPEPDDE